MKAMKLYKVPRNTTVKVVDEDIFGPPGSPEVTNGTIINFKHIDGMYSYCTTLDGTVVHLPAWTKVIIIEEPAMEEKTDEQL